MRKMGFLEKVTVLFHEEMAGSTAVAVMIKVNALIEFERFKKAWEILFKRQPLLRATIHIKDNDYFFDFNANFADITLKHMRNIDFADVMQEYGQGVVKKFDLKKYFWRATLITVQNDSCSYIIFGAPHSICDIRSISVLLGDLLHIIEDLDNGKIPSVESYPIPSALDSILDKSKFAKTIAVPEFTMTLSFEDEVGLEDAKTTNILKIIGPDAFTDLLKACRKHNLTINSALCAALTKALMENNTQDSIDLSTAFDLRPYTKEYTPNQVLAFYAHQLLFSLDLKENTDFWGLARQSREKYQKAINEYILESADNHELFANISAGIKNNIQNKQFFIPYSITNSGSMDAAFSGLKDCYKPDHFSFTIRNQWFGLIIMASTVNNTLYLNFNFPAPALNEQKMDILSDRVIFHLMENR